MNEEELLLQHLPQVHMVAKRIRQRFRNVDFDDLVGYGTIGLVKAIRGFDASRGILLKTYAEYRIRGEILDGLRGMNWLSRSAWRRKARYQQSISQDGGASAGGEAKGGERSYHGTRRRAAPPAPSPARPIAMPLLEIHCAGWQLDDLDEIAQKTGWRETRVTAHDPVAAYDRKQLARQVAKAIALLPRRDRDVLQMHYEGDLSLKQIGEVLKIHQSRVSQLHAAALQQLRARFQQANTSLPAEAKPPLSGRESIA